MESNLGPYDQLIRIVIGVAIGWECFLMPTHHGLLMFLSLAFLLSGFVGFLPGVRIGRRQHEQNQIRRGPTESPPSP